MADRSGSKHHPHSRKAMIHCRQRAVGLTGAIGMFLTLGLGPLANAPTVKADAFDAILDPIINSITSSLGDVAAGSAAVPELGSLSLGATESVAAASPVDAWLSGVEQDWINSGFGQQVDTAINSWFNLVDPTTTACGLICDGADGQGGGLIFGDAGADAQPMSENLLVNPGFETADPSGSGYSGVTIPGWTETGTPTVIAYGTQGGYPFAFSSPLPKFFDFPQDAPPGGGDNFAGGGPVATSAISQTVDLTGAAGTPFTLSADLGGQGWDPSDASVQVNFLDAHGDVLGTDSLNPVTIWDRLGFTGFEDRDISGTVPDGTTSAQVTTTFTDNDQFLAHYNGAYADNESFTVGDPSLTAAPLTLPTSDVGQLDHVFLIYMENKGVGNIVGSPNAPYINSLINTEDYDSNYFALGHPSDPNYFRIMGGSDFGIDYNPAGNVIDAPSLMQEMDQAGISWAGYGQGMPAPGTSSRRVTTPSTKCPSPNSTTSSTTPPPTCRNTCSRSRTWPTLCRTRAPSRNSRGSNPTRTATWKAPSILLLAFSSSLPASSRTSSTTSRPATSTSSKRYPPLKTRQRGLTRTRRTRSSSRGTRTTTICHWVSVTKATTFR